MVAFIHNTLGVKIKAQEKQVFHKAEALVEFFSTHPPKLFYVLGQGSNTLFTQDFGGVVVVPLLLGKRIIHETKEHIWLEVGAGEDWSSLVEYTVSQGWGGLENLALIPGTVGAAPIQNIGAYGQEFSNICSEVKVFQTMTNSQKVFLTSDCLFVYRGSIFKKNNPIVTPAVQKWKEQTAFHHRYSGFEGNLRPLPINSTDIVLSVTLKLAKTHEAQLSYVDHGRRSSLETELRKLHAGPYSPEEIWKVVVTIRQKKLPDIQKDFTAGSFFKNPIIPIELLKQWQSKPSSALKRKEIPSWPVDKDYVKVPAGWLLEDIGWRGKAIENCFTSPNQALIVQSNGQASGEEILKFIHTMQQDFHTAYGTWLEPEVVII